MDKTLPSLPDAVSGTPDGAARAPQQSELAGVFSGLAMGLKALATAAMLPVLRGLLL